MPCRNSNMYYAKTTMSHECHDYMRISFPTDRRSLSPVIKQNPLTPCSRTSVSIALTYAT